MPLSPDERRNIAITLLGLVVCLGLVLFVYWPGLSGPFMVDDEPNIQTGFIQNPDWDGIVYTVTHNGSGLFGRSASMLSFVLSGLQYGLDPWGFKFHNLMLHLLNGVLLLRLLQVLLPRLDAQLDERKVLLIAGATTALWLLHPLLVSTVMYVVQRMAMLSTLFTLLALLAYVHARAHTGDRRFYLFGWFVMPMMSVLAVLSKESGALIPVYLLVIEVCAFRTSLNELRANRRLLVFLAVFIALPLVLACVVVALNFAALTDYSMRTFTLQERLLTQLHVIVFYMRMILLPRIREMSLFHDDFALTTQFDVVTALLLLLLSGLLFLAWKMRRTYPVVSFGIWLFFAAHLLESTFLALELAFEHRNYFASAGLLLLPAYALLRTDDLRALRLLVPVIVLLFSFMTFTRATEWGDRELFHQMSVIEHPRSSRALNNLVNYLMASGRYEDAVANLEKLVALTPNDAGAFLHLQLVRCSRGERDDHALARAAELAGTQPMQAYGHSALQVLTVMVVEEKCKGLTVDDIAPVVTAAFTYAEANEAFNNYENLYFLRATIAMKRGQYAQAYSDFRVAHEISGRVDMLHELMKYQIRGQRFDDAEETLMLMEQQNSARFGIETYVVEQSRILLEDARQRAAASPAPGEAALATPGEPGLVL